MVLPSNSTHHGFTFACFFLLELVLPCLCWSHGGFLSLLCRRDDQTSTRLVVPFQLPPWCRHPRCHITPSTSFQSQRQVALDGNNPDNVKVKAPSLSGNNFSHLPIYHRVACTMCIAHDRSLQKMWVSVV